MELSLQQIIEEDIKVEIETLPKHPALVRQIQHGLMKLRLLSEGDITSRYDDRTDDALREFCRVSWLDTFARGLFGKTLATKLLEGLRLPEEDSGLKVNFVVESKPGLGLADYKIVAKQFQIEEAALRAVVKVESAGHAFLKGRPVILFEAHWFSYFTEGKYDKFYPHISCPEWNRSLYRTGEAEWRRFTEAEDLNPTAAYMSTSWGLGQVLGVNYAQCGYRTVQEFVVAMDRSAFNQLQAMMRFIDKAGLLGALRRRDWNAFAKGYNGPSYHLNCYAEKLEQAYLAGL